MLSAMVIYLLYIFDLLYFGIILITKMPKINIGVVPPIQANYGGLNQQQQQFQELKYQGNIDQPQKTGIQLSANTKRVVAGICCSASAVAITGGTVLVAPVGFLAGYGVTVLYQKAIQAAHEDQNTQKQTSQKLPNQTTKQDKIPQNTSNIKPQKQHQKQESSQISWHKIKKTAKSFWPFKSSQRQKFQDALTFFELKETEMSNKHIQWVYKSKKSYYSKYQQQDFYKNKLQKLQACYKLLKSKDEKLKQ